MSEEHNREALEKRVKELEHHIEQLEDKLIHDKLTGLKTRSFFEEETNLYLEMIFRQEELTKSGVHKRREKFGFRNLSILFFDIDFFKKVNDTYGHDVGDLVLQRVAETIDEKLRTGDTVARWGGEEMVASLLGADENDARQKAEEIRKAVEELTFEDLPKLKITISAGVASSETDLNIAGLTKRADEALYKAKGDGRNKVVKYSEINGNGDSK